MKMEVTKNITTNFRIQNRLFIFQSIHAYIDHNVVGGHNMSKVNYIYNLSLLIQREIFSLLCKFIKKESPTNFAKHLVFGAFLGGDFP